MTNSEKASWDSAMTWAAIVIVLLSIPFLFIPKIIQRKHSLPGSVIVAHKEGRAYALCTVTTESNQSVLGWFPMEQAYRPGPVLTVYRTNFAGCVFLPAAGSTVNPHYSWPK